jgi:hypothetical protein
MAPRKILYNTVYGGFGLSNRLCACLSPHLDIDFINEHDLSMRENPMLLQIIVAMAVRHVNVYLIFWKMLGFVIQSGWSH